MKKISLLVFVTALILSSCNNKTEEEEKNDSNTKILETEMDSVSYSLGVNMATSVKQQGMETIDANA